MLRQHRGRIVLWLAGGLTLGLALNAVAQTPLATSKAQTPNPQATPPAAAPAAPVTPEQTMLQALAANPVTAPYAFGVTRRNGRYVLRGRVGTKQIHDAAVQTMIALGYPMIDELVIDTAEAYRAAAAPRPAPVNPRSAAMAAWTGLAGPLAGAAGPLVGSPFGLSSYIYPPPLFGRYDDPFFGLEPPVISYPPWWRSIAYRAGAEAAAQAPPAQAAAPPGSAQPGAAAPAAEPASPGAAPPEGTIEMTIDPRGVAVIRGTVPTLADRIAVGQKLAQTPGIIEVENLLNVKQTGTAGTPVAPGASRDVPPPPPRPEPPPVEQPAAVPAPAPPPPAAVNAPATRRVNGIVVDQTDLSQRIARSMEKRPALVGQPIRASVREGIAYLSGRVPTAYEAMLAYRAAQQTPGVREVIDHLEFVVPDAETKNPLLEKGRPEDVEPYLEAQLKRQLGDVAHVDRVHVQGDRFEVQGTVSRPEDVPRVEAIVHSMPLLRGFRTEIRFQPE